MIRAGELRHYVTIRKEATEALDAAGNPSVATWTTWTAHVGIEPMSMAERAYAGAMGAEATHKIIARYDSRLDNTCRVAYGTREFRVTSAITKDERNREMTLMAAETVGDTVSLTSLYGLSFTGTQQATYAGRLRPLATGTVGMWVKPGGTWVIGTKQALLAIGKSVSTSCVIVRINPTSTTAAGVGVEVAGTEIVTTTGVTLSTWKHVALSCDGTNFRLYVAGVLAATGAQTELWTAAASDGKTVLGGAWNGATYSWPLTGEIVAPFVSDGALNVTQIAAVMANTAPLNMAAWYPGEASGSTLADGSGNALDMTLVGSPTRTGPYTSLSGGPG